MKIVILLLAVGSAWVFADAIDDQVDFLQAQMQKALDVRNLNDENVRRKMQEISKTLPSSDLNRLNQRVHNIEGMSPEELRKMDILVKQELDKHGVTKSDLKQVKRQISDLIPSQ